MASAAKCLASIRLCRVRVTRLDEPGNPVAGPNNVYVTNKPLSIGVTPQIEAGKDITLTGGCDCIVARYRGNDKLKGFDLELDIAQLEPAMMEMMVGAAAIVESGIVIGNWWPSQLSCDDAPQPNVCVEGWQDAWDDDHQANSPHRFVHWIWPSTRWQIGAHTLQDEFTQPKITGFTRGNPNWGLGIFGDLPEAAGPNGGWFFADEIPDADCAYQTASIT